MSRHLFRRISRYPCTRHVWQQHTRVNLQGPLLLCFQLGQAVELNLCAFLPRSLRIEPSVNMHSGALGELAVRS